MQRKLTMATLDHDDRPTLAPPARTLLGALRRRIRQYVWLEGSAAAVAWLGTAFWATLAADWFFEPSPPVRAVMLAAVAAVVVLILFRMIGRRAFVPITDSNAATVLERRFPQLNDSLLTVVELGNRPVDDNLSEEMLAITCREASARVEEVELRKVFNPRPLWLHCGAATLLTISVAMFAVLFSGAFGVWANRVLALSGDLWPRYSDISVDGFTDGLRKVARGSDVEIVAKADTRMPRVPEKVEIRYRTEGGGRGRVTMDRHGISRGEEDYYQEFSHTFRGVLSDIDFDVIGGDDRVSNLRIQAVDSPMISRMTLDCELPAYIRRRQPPLPVTGVMQIPMGSRVTVHAEEANKELVRVRVDKVVADRSETTEVLETDKLNADHRGFSHTLERLDDNTTLLFTLTDVDGITGREPVRLVLVAAPDQPPQMAVQLDGIGAAITPQASVPVVGRIADDYGIGRVWFEYAIDDREPAGQPIAELPRAPAAFNLDDAALEVRPLGVKPGQKLLITVRAVDLCDLGQGPNLAGSERWLLEIVTPDQLRAMLEARELVLRQRFERMLQEVAETRDLLARLDFESDESANPAAAPAGSEPGDMPDNIDSVDTPERRAALRLLRVQSALSNCRKNAQEVLGVAEAFDDIRKQLVNNRIDTEELKKRIQEGIARPLHEIAGEMFPELERRIETLQADLESPKQGPALRNRAQAQADEILLAMQKVRDRMLELESFNEAVELLRKIVEMHKELKEETQRRHKQKIRDLLKE